MTPFWAPLSALRLTEPASLATPMVLKLLIRSDREGRGTRIAYAGDSMWPAVLHLEEILVDPIPARQPAPGQVVLACPSGIPDLLRVTAVREGTARLCGDSDPSGGTELPVSEILAVARLTRRRPGGLRRLARRILIDAGEALRGRVDSADEPASSVRAKYDSQAPFYAVSRGQELGERVFDRLRSTVPPGGRILVAGSGSGRECFALAAEGWSVAGVDFAPAMVSLAESGARERGLDIPFRLADLRTHEEEPASLDAVVFTYDVYSFIPDSADRVALLRRISRWLRRGGVVLLSARVRQDVYARAILALQWWAHRREPRYQWGDTHTRWFGPDGALRRSFVHTFSRRSLLREAGKAGFLVGASTGGHFVLRARQ